MQHPQSHQIVIPYILPIFTWYLMQLQSCRIYLMNKVCEEEIQLYITRKVGLTIISAYNAFSSFQVH